VEETNLNISNQQSARHINSHWIGL